MSNCFVKVRPGLGPDLSIFTNFASYQIHIPIQLISEVKYLRLSKISALTLKTLNFKMDFQFLNNDQSI